MKRQILVGMLSIGLAGAAIAEEAPVEGAQVAAAQGSTAKDEVQHRTYNAGNQLLIDISARVGGDLDQRLEQEVGKEVTVRLRDEDLLVSNN